MHIFSEIECILNLDTSVSKRGGVMKLSIGLFGFGRTGSIVANEIIKDEDCELKWVLRKSTKNEGEYASHLLGFEHDEGRIFSIAHVDFDNFYRDHRVDVIIDFSISNAVNEYKNAVKYGTRIVSAISNYEKEEIEQLKRTWPRNSSFIFTQYHVGYQFLNRSIKGIAKSCTKR